MINSLELKTVSGIKHLGGDDIPEWLLVEVLVRLPVKFVFRCKRVSKQWLSVVSDPFFARMYVSRYSMSPQSQPWTFISHNMHGEDCGFREGKLLAEEDIHSRIGFKHPSYLVLPCPYGTRYNVVGVNNGLVLYHVFQYSKWSTYPYNGFYRFGICNPITGQWITLPPYRHWNKFVKPGFLTRVENYILTSYIVVHLEIPPAPNTEKIKFTVFNSEIGEWKDFTVCVDQSIQINVSKKPIALNGIMHWMTHKHGIIAYDPCYKTDCLRFIALPDIMFNSRRDLIYSLLDVHQGHLGYFESSFRLETSSGLGVWLLNDYSTGEWCMQHRVRYGDILSREFLSSIEYFPAPISFHPFNSDIVYMGCLGSDIRFVSYNMKTKKFKDCNGSPDIIAHNEYDINWWLTFLLTIPSWPISIPLPSFGVAKD